MKKQYTLTKQDGSIEAFEDKRAFERAARKAKQEEERAEERRHKNKREAHRNACVALVQLAHAIDANDAKNYHFARVEEHCAPNGYLRCKVPCNSVLNPDPTQKDFASLLGVGLVECIMFDIMDDAVAFKHFNGFWFTVGVHLGVGEQVRIPQSLGAKLDALCKDRK